VPLVFAVQTGRIGLDYGNHWDEHLQCRLVARSLKSGVLLPGVYNYPMVPYWLTWSALGFRSVFRDYRRDELMNDLSNSWLVPVETDALQRYVLEDHGFLLRVRLIFLVVSSLSVLWVYLLVLSWRRHLGEAFLASAFLCLSWEAAYHSRWIAPDQVMTSFAALTMLFIMLVSVRRGPRQLCLYGATVAAALASGTKYQSVILVLPLAIVAYQTRDRTQSLWVLVRELVGLGALFTVAFVLITPAIYLDPARFVSWLVLMRDWYKQGGHFGQDVGPGLPHLWRIFNYLGRDFFSFLQPIAVLLATFAIIGAVQIVRESRRRAAVFLILPVLYILYMCSQKVLNVRNLLIVGPFLAIAAARGVRTTAALVKVRWARWALVAGVGVVLLVNANWLYQASLSIARNTPNRILQDFSQYVQTKPAHYVYASVTVRTRLNALHLDSSRLADTPQGSQEWAFYADDWANFSTRPSNLTRFARTWFGSFEVNWNYYTNWIGPHRIVLVPAKRAEAQRVRLWPRPL
jgi:4-amino-4-deoxy-L-arabinose transferase-like glycosyltransferase